MNAVSTHVRWFLAAGILFTACGAVSPGLSVEETVEKTFPADGVREIRIQNINGDIHVASSGGGDVVVRAEITARGADREQARKNLENIHLQWSHKGGVVSVEVRGKHSPLFGGRRVPGRVSFEVLVPHPVDLGMHSVNGSLQVETPVGRVRAETVNGRLSVKECDSLEGETVNGSVEAAVGRSATVETVNGSIRLRAPRGLGGDTHLETVNGAVEIRMPADVNARLDLQSLTGGIRLEGVNTEGLRRKRTKVEGVLGKGGPRLQAETINGGILLSVK